jgi:hypothetical protein
MTYVGRGVDAISNVEKLDNITFDGSTTYNLTKSSVAFTPSGKNNILVSINGVVQQGNFTVAGATIVFDFSPTSDDTCNFIMHYGTALINVPADSSVNMAQLGASGTKSSSTFLAGDNTFKTISSFDPDAAVVFNESSADVDFRVESNDNTHMVFVDGGNNRVGIGKSAPSSTLHVEDNANYSLKISKSGSNIHAAQFSSNGTASLGIAVDESNNQVRLNSEGSNDSLVLEVADGTDGIVIDSSGHVTMPLQPAAIARTGAQSNVTGDENNHTVTFGGSEITDQNADFASPTFTAPVDGVYLAVYSVSIGGLASNHTRALMYINTSNRIYYVQSANTANQKNSTSMIYNVSAIMDMDANDTVSTSLRIDGGSRVVDIDDIGSAGIIKIA